MKTWVNYDFSRNKIMQLADTILCRILIHVKNLFVKACTVTCNFSLGKNMVMKISKALPIPLRVKGGFSTTLVRNRTINAVTYFFGQKIDRY